MTECLSAEFWLHRQGAFLKTWVLLCSSWKLSKSDVTWQYRGLLTLNGFSALSCRLQTYVLSLPTPMLALPALLSFTLGCTGSGAFMAVCISPYVEQRTATSGADPARE